MSRRKKGKQKLIGSIIGIIVLILAGIFGLNNENINEFLGIENNTNNNVTEEITTT